MMTMTSESHSLRLVTLNTFGVPVRGTRTRLRTLARELNVANVDVVCLQEVQLSPYVGLLRREFHALPHAAFAPRLYAPKGGLMTLSRHHHHRVQFRPYRRRGFDIGPAVADWMLHKGALVTELAARVTPTIIVNTHLNANYDGDWSESNRYARVEHEQVMELAEIVRDLDPAALVAVAGDFNFPRSSWLYNDFVTRSGVIDPLATSTTPTYRPHRVLPPRYAQPIDFVFIRPPRGVLVRTQAQTLFDQHVDFVNGQRGYLSDHYAIGVEITWEG
jgi:endonuclease/exonuclease/phosphatase family metal-dependent hydrolase